MPGSGYRKVARAIESGVKDLSQIIIAPMALCAPLPAGIVNALRARAGLDEKQEQLSRLVGILNSCMHAGSAQERKNGFTRMTVNCYHLPH
jgi:hypothetical protein